MKFLIRPFVFVLLSFALAQEAFPESLPEFRPALLGNHARSLINLIDAKKLMDRGQKDAVVMFECGVTEQGYGVYSRTYRESPNSDLLKNEVLGRIDQAQFEPAVFNHSHVNVYVGGTVMFLIHDGVPHVRIFLNQENTEMKAGHDFIAPQFAFVPNNPAFKGIYYPPQAPGHSGVASLDMSVDEKGHVKSARVVYEHPAGMGFGAQSVGPVRDALFIPGFRDGKPVACRYTWSLIFTGPGRQMKTG